jgi:hypothetical protein
MVSSAANGRWNRSDLQGLPGMGSTIQNGGCLPGSESLVRKTKADITADGGHPATQPHPVRAWGIALSRPVGEGEPGCRLQIALPSPSPAHASKALTRQDTPPGTPPRPGVSANRPPRAIFGCTGLGLFERQPWPLLTASGYGLGSRCCPPR